MAQLETVLGNPSLQAKTSWPLCHVTIFFSHLGTRQIICHQENMASREHEQGKAWTFSFWKHVIFIYINYNCEGMKHEGEWGIQQNCLLLLCVMRSSTFSTLNMITITKQRNPLLPVPNEKEQSYLDIKVSYKKKKTCHPPGEAVNTLYLCSLTIYKQLFCLPSVNESQGGLYCLYMWNNSSNRTTHQLKNWCGWYMTS